MKRKILAGLTALLLAGGGVAISAAPASAHTGGVSGVAICEPGGTYSVERTYSARNVPDGVEAETKAFTGGADMGPFIWFSGIVGVSGMIFLIIAFFYRRRHPVE